MADQDLPIRVSIITATFNSEQVISRLISSLMFQSDQDFEWVVADGGSDDSTLEILEQTKPLLRNMVFDSRPDFGIYDALNRAVRIASGSFYIVAGADDSFHPKAVENFKAAITTSGADFISAYVRSGNTLNGPRKLQWPWLHGPFAYVSGHAVSLAIRRDLHQRVGYYSRKFPIAADQWFILEAIQQGATVSQHAFEAGSFDAVGGTSGQDVLGTLLEGYRVQIATGQSKFVQTLVLLVRIIKNWPSIL
jgi:glycosyltransferase involved in cell wall biosynthesis